MGRRWWSGSFASRGRRARPVLVVVTVLMAGALPPPQGGRSAFGERSPAETLYGAALGGGRADAATAGTGRAGRLLPAGVDFGDPRAVASAYLAAVCSSASRDLDGWSGAAGFLTSAARARQRAGTAWRLVWPDRVVPSGRAGCVMTAALVAHGRPAADRCGVDRCGVDRSGVWVAVRVPRPGRVASEGVTSYDVSLVRVGTRWLVDRVSGPTQSADHDPD